MAFRTRSDRLSCRHARGLGSSGCCTRLLYLEDGGHSRHATYSMLGVAIKWSSIHRQLGVTPCDLDYGMIRDAVSQQLPEADGLDWKRSEPNAT